MAFTETYYNIFAEAGRYSSLNRPSRSISDDFLPLQGKKYFTHLNVGEETIGHFGTLASMKYIVVREK